MLKAPKTRLVPGTTDWQYTCAALPKGTDIEWKWGVCRPDGTNAVMERWDQPIHIAQQQKHNQLLDICTMGGVRPCHGHQNSTG